MESGASNLSGRCRKNQDGGFDPDLPLEPQLSEGPLPLQSGHGRERYAINATLRWP
jgi:hypothetical protein